MIQVKLVPHQLKYAKSISELSSAPQIREVLGVEEQHTTVEGTEEFIRFIIEQERLGKQYSRVIVNEDEKIIGIITLKDINHLTKSSHIGTWIGHPFWGMGYNELAKRDILYKAFTKFNLQYVFAGAKLSNIRSQKAQEKLPYITLGAEKDFPHEYEKLLSQVKEPCVLNVIKKDNFLDWYRSEGTDN